MSEPRTLMPVERKTWRALYEVHGLVTRRIENDLHQAGVGSLSDYGVLYALYLAPDKRVRLAELAEMAMLSRSGLTRLLDRLEVHEYLRREPFPEDRRGTLAVLTETGIEEMRRIWAVYSAGIANYFAAELTEAEAESMTAVFRRITKVLKETEQPGSVSSLPETLRAESE